MCLIFFIQFCSNGIWSKKTHRPTDNTTFVANQKSSSLSFLWGEVSFSQFMFLWSIVSFFLSIFLFLCSLFFCWLCVSSSNIIFWLAWLIGRLAGTREKHLTAKICATHTKILARIFAFLNHNYAKEKYQKNSSKQILFSHLKILLSV